MDIAEPFQGFFSMFHPGVPAEVFLDYNPYRELTYKPTASFSKLRVTFIPLSITGLNYLWRYCKKVGHLSIEAELAML